MSFTILIFSYDHVIEHFEVSAGKTSTLCTDEIRAPLVKEPLKNRARGVVFIFISIEILFLY